MRLHSLVLAGGVLCTLSALSNAESWIFVENIDLMTDEDTSSAAIINGRKELVSIRCNGEDHYDIFVGVGEYIGGERQPVSYRFDSDEPVMAGNWNLSTDSSIVFAPDSQKSTLVELLRTRNKVTLQIKNFRGFRPVAQFSLQGSEAAISQLNCID